MNPNNTSAPGFELPAPVEAEGAGGNEQAARPEVSGNQRPAPAPQQAPAPQAPQPQQAAAQPLMPTAPALQAPTSAGPMVADEADLIEKEWIDKAKAIVAATRNDPHIQNRELNKFKADYMQKRYNKTIKVDES